MRRVWLIRAGENAEVLDAMRLAGLIGMRYEKVGDASLVSDAEIEQGVADDGHEGGAAMLRSILRQFANDVRPGDLVVSPNTPRREVWLGVVAGEYQFNDPPLVPRYLHTRTVEWLGWLDRDAAWMRDQLKSLDRPRTLFELPSREWWWRQVDTRELSSRPRSVWSKPPPTRTRTRSSASTSAPKAAPTPRKVPVEMIRCAGTCGFQWARSSLVDGLCADCRADL